MKTRCREALRHQSEERAGPIFVWPDRDDSARRERWVARDMRRQRIGMRWVFAPCGVLVSLVGLVLIVTGSVAG